MMMQMEVALLLLVTKMDEIMVKNVGVLEVQNHQDAQWKLEPQIMYAAAILLIDGLLILL